MATGNNELFLRNWFEVSFFEVSFNSESVEQFHSTEKKYIPYNKGGSYRKWFGNIEYVIRFDKKNYQILGSVGNHLPSRDFYCQEAITWSKVTSGGLSMRYVPKGAAFDVAGCSIFTSSENLYFIMGLCNANIMQSMISVLSQTINYEVGTIKVMPVIKKQNDVVGEIVQRNVKLSKEDWDSFETSWDFKKHPLI